MGNRVGGKGSVAGTNWEGGCFSVCIDDIPAPLWKDDLEFFVFLDFLGAWSYVAFL